MIKIEVRNNNIAIYFAVFLYLAAAISCFIANYFIATLIMASFSLLALLKKKIVLDLLLVILFIAALSSLTIFFPFHDMDKVEFSLIEKLITSITVFSLFFLYSYFLNQYTKISKRQLILSIVFIILSLTLAILAY